MSTLSEHTGNENPTETSLRREDTKEQIYGVLQHFDVLPSRVDRFIFKYIYVYLLGLFLLAELLYIIYLLNLNLRVGEVLLRRVGLGVSPLVATILAIWRFNAWRSRTPKTLCDLWEKKRISLFDDDADTSDLGLLEQYRDALASPKRYFLGGFPMIFLGILYAYDIVQNLSNILLVGTCS